MNWPSIFGQSTSRQEFVPVLNALQQQRLKQIESLRSFHPSVAEVRKDTEYKITIFINDEALHLHVYLPPNFPNEVPVVTVSPAVKHPWVNDQMVVFGCDSLNNFYMHSNLGRTLQDVCKQFLENHPTFCSRSHILPASSSESRLPTPLYKVQPTSKTTSQLPGAPHTNPEGFTKVYQVLESCSIEELKELDSNSGKLMQLILNVDFINSSKKKRDDQMAKIENIARENMEQRKPRLEAARHRLVAKFEELSLVRQEFDRWSRKQNDLLEMCTPQLIHSSLQVGVAQMEEESENIAEKFLSEDIRIEEFIKNFIEKRKLTHMRRWKEENVLKL